MAGPVVTDTTLSTVDAASRAGVTVRQLNHWAAQGYVVPEIVHGTPGRGGIGKRWSVGEVDVAELLGVFSRQLLRDDLLGRLTDAIRGSTGLSLFDGDYVVRVTVKARAYDAAPVGSGID